MISAFQERMDHFENKLSTKDKEIGVLKETISAFSKHSRSSETFQVIRNIIINDLEIKLHR